MQLEVANSMSHKDRSLYGERALPPRGCEGGDGCTFRFNDIDGGVHTLHTLPVAPVGRTKWKSTELHTRNGRLYSNHASSVFVQLLPIGDSQ